MLRLNLIVLFAIIAASSVTGQEGQIETKWLATRRFQVSNDRHLYVLSSMNEYATDPASVKNTEGGALYQTIIVPSGRRIKGCNDPYKPHQQLLGGYVQKVIRVSESPWIAYLVTTTRIYRINKDSLEEVVNLEAPYEFWFTDASGKLLLPVYAKWESGSSSLDRKLHAVMHYENNEWKQVLYQGNQKGHIQQSRSFNVVWGQDKTMAVNGTVLILEPARESDFRRILFANGQFFDLPPEEITIQGNTVTVTTPPFSIRVKD